ncbi:related to Na+/H+ antiporter AnNHA1 [Sporisorium reilianum SRZ2]|uniref:Related to Na+/H+ antiporter AnNHA1 n=1 Tax=Sporisorium reilianum (strain SRZ2) TaxID=999809 RepID=E6ZUV7_SPORE|nr:related to Na+/H+ antiporter AnNHA1 [Sporisorium reilianum SRZ2]
MGEAFHPFEVTPVHIVYVGLGLFICIFSYLSLFIKERLYLGEAPIAAAFGIIVGPIAINLFNPAKWGNEDGVTPGGVRTDEITLEIMRVTIALSVFAIGVELPKKYLLRHWKSIAILLGPVMAWGWLITACFIYALIPGLDFLNSLVVAACVSPTDPILAQAVVGGPWAEKHVPAHVRHMLMCESGCNDGAAFPFLYLALYLTQNRDNTRHAIAQWFYETWAYEIILGTILGALIGYLARKFMRFSERNKLIDRESFVAQYISLAIASMGVNVLLGSDDLLAAFACGTAFAWDGWFTKQTEDSNFSNIVDLLFNIATFIYIGALIPWHDFVDHEIGLSIWRLLVLTICVLLTKRIPVILALWKFIPDIKTFREAIFCGHFGPMGVGAIFIATLGRTLMPEEVHEPPQTTNDVLALTIQPIVYFFVLCSIIVHGFTIPFFAFGKNARRRAHTLTRTWSRNPSMRDDEPSWMSRVRRVRTGEDIVINTDDISADKMSAQQLALIGRGAIGGYREDELRREDSNDENSATAAAASSASSKDQEPSYVGLLNTRTERDLEKAEGLGAEWNEKQADDGADQSLDGDAARRRQLCKDMDGIEDWEGSDEDSNPAADYLGQDCIEMRRYREKMQAKREAELARARSKQQAAEEEDKRRASKEEQDLGEAPMDRDIILGRVQADDEDEACRQDREGQARTHATSNDEKDESNWPKVRSWVEGHNLVLEHQKSYSDDPDVEVIPLTDRERDALEESETPAQDWVRQHHDELACFLGHEDHAKWNASETISRLLENKVHKWWPNKDKKHYVKATAPEEETAQDRQDRVNLMYGAMSWAQDRRGDDEERDIPLRSSRTDAHESAQEDGTSVHMPPAVVSALADSGGRSVGPQDSSVPPGSTSAQDTERDVSSPSAPAAASSKSGMSSRRAGGSAPRRGNLRKKVLSGQIGLSGRRKSADSKESDEDQEVMEDEDGEDDVASTKPRVMISEPASPTMTRDRSSHKLSPSSSFRAIGGIGDKGKAKDAGKEKFFPRSSSAGAGLAAPYRTSSAITNSPILKASAPPSRLGSSAGRDADPSKRTSSSVQWLDIADASHDHPSAPRRGPINEAGAQAFSRRARTYNGASSSGKEMTRDARVYHLDSDESDDDDAASSDDDHRRHGGLGIRDGMNRIGAFFQNFTAPKGEGMGNPGPTSHPHLFPSRSRTEPEQTTARSSSARHSPVSSRSLRREITRDDDLEGFALPPAAATAEASSPPSPEGAFAARRSRGATASASASGTSTPRVLLDLPNQDGPPVSPGQQPR